MTQFVKQVCAHFIDGTQMSMTAFNAKKHDPGYTAIIENHPAELASSHQIKCFIYKFIHVGNLVFRTMLLWLFIWRLRIEKPQILILFSDALFRSGSIHGNSNHEFARAVGRLVRAIRKYYRDIPIILTSDSAFFDEKNFDYFKNELKIYYICAGKFYEDLKQTIANMALESLVRNETVWQYADFGDRRQSWKQFRRIIFTRLISDDHHQLSFDFSASESLIYTNIGMNTAYDEKLILKVTAPVYEQLKLGLLWDRSMNAPPIFA